MPRKKKAIVPPVPPPEQTPAPSASVVGSFQPGDLSRRVIALPLQKRFDEQEPTNPGQPYKIIIDVNLDYQGGRDAARIKIYRLIQKLVAAETATTGQVVQGVNLTKSALSNQYLFGQLTKAVILELIKQDSRPESEDSSQSRGDAAPATTPGGSAAGAAQIPGASGGLSGRAHRAIHLVWPDSTIRARLTKSLATVKADAAHYSFSASGDQIIWAVLDSGIEKDHVHFQKHGNLAVPAPLTHRDFTVVKGPGVEGPNPLALPPLTQIGPDERPLEDAFGHGTHVAGIIAGESTGRDPDGKAVEILAVVSEQDPDGDPAFHRLSTQEIPAISGMAPRCQLLSLRVLDDEGTGDASSLIAAIGYIQEINGYGRRILIHGVNISAGYPFYPEWFACGQSPVCVEVDRLVKSGVVVVVAAGNTGYELQQVYHFRADGSLPPTPAGQGLSINDPGNAENAITVGSTHREMPHRYGVSYFSSKGPTGDGRAKPDLVAPGEKVISCAAGNARLRRQNEINDQKGCDYLEDSGTSMAAPHVSGVIAAFLSIRREYIGRPEEVKQIFTSSATDLRRDRYFQGSGLVDLMRAIQSV